MIKKLPKTELEIKMQELHDYCEANGVPIFLAAWQNVDNGNAGYVYQFLPPACVDIDIAEQTGMQDKFPTFLKIVAGVGGADNG